MTVENVNYISDLEPSKPAGSDRISLGDDHIRNIKKSLRSTFPNIKGEVTVTHGELNYLSGLDQPINDLVDQGSQGLTELEDRVKAIEDGLSNEGQDLSDQVNTNTSEIQALKDAIAEMGGGDGGMIKAATPQPAMAGDFEIEAFGQNYKHNCSPGGGTGNHKLIVPDGMVFCFEYLYGLTDGDDQAPAPTLTVPLEGIYIDGQPLYSSNQYDLSYNGGGPIWPGNDKKVIVRVEESMEFRNVKNDATHSQASWRTKAWLHIAGWFAEA